MSQITNHQTNSSTKRQSRNQNHATENLAQSNTKSNLDNENSESSFKVKRNKFYLSIHWQIVIFTALATIYYFYVKRKRIRESDGGLTFWKIFNAYECTCFKNDGDCE